MEGTGIPPRRHSRRRCVLVLVSPAELCFSSPSSSRATSVQAVLLPVCPLPTAARRGAGSLHQLDPIDSAPAAPVSPLNPTSRQADSPPGIQVAYADLAVLRVTDAGGGRGAGFVVADETKLRSLTLGRVGDSCRARQAGKSRGEDELGWPAHRGELGGTRPARVWIGTGCRGGKVPYHNRVLPSRCQESRRCLGLPASSILY